MKTDLKSFDALIVGGGTAGVVAGIQAARAGARTLIVERSAQLGGTMTNAGVCHPGLFHAGRRQVIGGIGWELTMRAAEEGNTPLPDFNDSSLAHWARQVRLNPAAYAAVCDDAVLTAGAELLLHTMLASLDRDGDGWRVGLCTKTGLEYRRARIVVDATGDGTAAHLAGAPLVQPEVCQPATLSCQLGGYDPDALNLPALNDAFRAACAAGELKPEDASWRIDRPDVVGWLRKRGMNANHVRMGVEARTSEGRTRLEVEGRRSVHRIVCWLRRQPGLGGICVERVFPEIGVRETVRIAGEATVTLGDYESGRIWPETIGHACYPIDIHGMTSEEWQAWPLAADVAPTVPRGALIPTGCPGLLAAGRLISSDRLAHSALRVEATSMATGQAAGALAALAAAEGQTPSAVPYAQLRTLLLEHGAILPDMGTEK
jgi:glycine/D-amino acid oxidase-like deaminating enzyme